MIVMKENIFVLTGPWKQKAWHATQGKKKKQQGWLESRGSEGKMCATFMVVSIGKIRQDQEIRFSISKFE